MQGASDAMARNLTVGVHAVKLTLVAQTPYQLLSCVLLSFYSKCKCELWLVDRVMHRFLEPSRASGLWTSVTYIEKSGIDPWKNDLGSKLQRFRNLRTSMRKIRDDLTAAPPDVIAIGSDNHELTAYFAQLGPLVGARVVLFEEGSTVHQSPYRARAPYWKQLLRKLLRLPNPLGYSIGWSPGISTVVVANASNSHPNYLQDRRVINWPAGPFPEEVVRWFLRTFSDGSLEEDQTVDLVYLGSPMQEEGWMSAEDEEELIRSVTRFGRACIKPHHFDSPKKYEAHSTTILPHSLWHIPAEVLFHILRPKVAVSVFSSAGINYATRYSRTAIFIAPASIPRHIIALIERQESTCNHIKVARTPAQLSAAIEEAMREDYERVTLSDQAWRTVVEKIIYTH